MRSRTTPGPRCQLAESRELLGDYLVLHQIHSATRESGVLENTEVLEELVRLRAEGLKIGLTLSGPNLGETLRRALEVTIAGGPVFDCVHATWNLLEPSAGSALMLAHQAGLGLVVPGQFAHALPWLRRQKSSPSHAKPRYRRGRVPSYPVIRRQMLRPSR
jgi:hypothetical protein